MPRPSTHGSASLPPATPAATILRSALSPLLVARRYWNAMFRAAVFQVLLRRFFDFYITAFSVFFAAAKSFFHFFQFVRIEPFGAAGSYA